MDKVFTNIYITLPLVLLLFIFITKKLMIIAEFIGRILGIEQFIMKLINKRNNN